MTVPGFAVYARTGAATALWEGGNGHVTADWMESSPRGVVVDGLVDAQLVSAISDVTPMNATVRYRVHEVAHATVRCRTYEYAPPNVRCRTYGIALWGLVIPRDSTREKNAVLFLRSNLTALTQAVNIRPEG
jgi:hypothetical protein